MNKRILLLVAGSTVGAALFFQNFTSLNPKENDLRPKWYNEVRYINPGTEGLYSGLSTVGYTSNSGSQYLNQLVCVDENDLALPLDPLTCSTKRRIQVGEDLPYVKYSKNLKTGTRSVMQNSYPLAFGNRVRFMNTRTGYSFKSDGRIFRNFNVGDGYDIQDNYNGWSFIYGTKDPVTTDSNYIWCGEFGDLGGGWMLSPNPPNKAGNKISKISGGPIGQCSPTGSTYTEFYPMNYTFSSGKNLQVVKTLHFSGRSASSSDAIEIFYNSRIYGGVRWEAWKSTKQSSDGSTECNGPSEAIHGGKKFYRSMCKDWTFIEPLTIPLHSFYVPLTPTFTSSPNLIMNSDFVNRLDSWLIQLGETGGDLRLTPKSDLATSNPYLTVQKMSGEVPNLYQNARYVLNNRSDSIVNGGLLIRSNDVNATGVIAVEISADNMAKMTHKIRFGFKNTNWSVLRFHFDVDLSGRKNVKLTWRFYPKGMGTFDLDEVFLAVTDKNIQ